MATTQLYSSKAGFGINKANAVKAPRTIASRSRTVVVRASKVHFS